MFGSSTTAQPSAQGAKPAGLFSLNTNTGSPSMFGNQLKPAEQKPFSFGLSQPPQQAQQPQQQTTSLFGPSAQQGTTTGGSIFGGFNQSQQQQQQPQQSFQQSQQQTQRPFDQTLRFGVSGQQPPQNMAQSIWEEGRGMGVYRPIPAQMNIVKDKWNPSNISSPLRTYLYQHVADESEALRYRPGPDEDEDKWEEAVSKRPGSTWVPLLVRGFFELGKKAQIQMEAIQRCNMMLQEINTSLDMQLDVHRQKVASRLAECKRRQLASSRRTLALAVKVQILRNKCYVMDNAEEELKDKLEKMERDVFDPSLNAREQEIWARMLGIRDRAKRLKSEMEKLSPTAKPEEPVLDEGTIKAAKDILEAYDVQLRHLHKELQLVQQEFEDWEKLSNTKDVEPIRRR